MSCLITMSQKELHRLELIQRISGRSHSQVRRLLERIRTSGYGIT